MIVPSNLKRTIDILNSEGCILGLNTDNNGNLYLSSYLKDGSGYVFYSTTESQLKQFLQSKTTIEQIYSASADFSIKYKSRSEVVTSLKEDYQSKLMLGLKYYHDLPNSMKSTEFETKYGN